ncbi:winged helix-turn-helix transcriptional regulator [Bradyrhizobium sp. HKCCYLS20291]|uniref:winged helix-turn-helix transcriptional regulator n=1 Tax=Bradyrhizobium sp. HKCCYLS20291 TaxID=3420766 RepID=UPI003EB79486
MKDDPSLDCTPDSLNCPVVRAVGALGGKWKLHIVYHLMGGVMRFGELHRAIAGVTQQMLTAQLRELEADGIVLRTVYPQVPPKVEYSLTATGKELEPLIDALVIWGQKLPRMPGGVEGGADVDRASEKRPSSVSR